MIGAAVGSPRRWRRSEAFAFAAAVTAALAGAALRVDADGAWCLPLEFLGPGLLVRPAVGTHL